MSDFLRPEAKATLSRWRETLIGAAVLGLGLWLALTRFGFLSWLGWIVAALGLALIYTGVQHLRFRSLGQGPGVVEITERRVAYYGPVVGGVADMDLLARLELIPGHWRLTSLTGESLQIPVNATGAEALYDLFASLPGLRTEAMLQTLGAKPDAPVTVWESPARRLN